MSSPCCRFGSLTAEVLGFRVQGSSSGAEGEEIHDVNTQGQSTERLDV